MFPGVLIIQYITPDSKPRSKLDLKGEVMTFSQAAKAYPEYFKY